MIVQHFDVLVPGTVVVAARRAGLYGRSRRAVERLGDRFPDQRLDRSAGRPYSCNNCCPTANMWLAKLQANTAAR